MLNVPDSMRFDALCKLPSRDRLAEAKSAARRWTPFQLLNLFEHHLLARACVPPSGFSKSICVSLYTYYKIYSRAL
jgi:hypothetical protein